ncbi:MAG TPA: hypothetical protein VGL63_12075 [Streptosporangiaceae bacterium]
MFRTSADLAVAVCGVLEAIFFGLVASGRDKAAESSPASQEIIAEARSRLRSVVRSQVTEQANALTARGLLTVPWNRTGDPTQARSSVAELARAVEAGRQLIVLGGSQSGKTTLATRLAETLAAHPGRQPVLFSLSTWNHGQVWLKDWMLLTIRTAYNLMSAADAQAAEEAFREGTIIPVFDGLDEIEASHRMSAAETIHQLVGTTPAVLTSVATPETEQAARVALPSAEIIKLRPVATEEVSRYLLESPMAEVGELAPLTSGIVEAPESAAGQALSSPLMAWLAKTIYVADTHAAHSRGIARPDELVDPAHFPDAESVERHLLRSLPTAVFERYSLRSRAPGSPAGAFTPAQADRWLAFLAARATRRIIGFWEFRSYAPLFRIALLAAAVAGCVIAIIGSAVPYLAGPGYFLLLAGAVFGFAWSRGYAVTRARVADPTRIGYGYTGQDDGDLRLHTLRLARAAAAALVAYAAGVVTQAVRGQAGWLFGLTPSEFGAAAFVAIMLCFVIANLGGRIAGWILLHRPGIDAHMGARAGDPLAAIRSDRRSGAAILVVGTTVLAAGIALYDVVFLPADAIWNLSLAPVSASVAAFIWNEWICFKVAHQWLALRGRLPWRLSLFLRQCHEGGILRKNGNHFEFRHRRLQESLQTAGDEDERR